MRNNTRDRFLMEYARSLRTELNDFVEGSGAVHRASVLVGGTSQVVIEVLKEGDPWTEIILTRQTEEWMPSPNAIIDFEAPNRIIVTRPSERLEQMLAWSNVQAWDDAGFIISHILNASRGITSWHFAFP